jgi:hypothetical protein
VGDLPAPVDAGASPAVRDTESMPGGGAAQVSPVTAGAADGLGLGSGGVAGLGVLLLVSFASVGATLVRRRRLHQAFAARVATRLNAIAGPAGQQREAPDDRSEVPR